MQRSLRPPIIGMGVLKYMNSADFKITKSTLLPSISAQPSHSGAKSMSYYSKVAEVNERGELSGDETTQSGTSEGSEEEDTNVE